MQKVSDILQRDVLKMIYLAIMAIFIYGPVSGFDGQYNFSRISTKDGLSQLSVLTIFQDSKGYMWFGTRDGLNRFDGQSFKHWYSDLNDSSSISDNYNALPLSQRSAATSLLFMNAAQCCPDKQFRFPVTQFLLDYAGIGKEVMIVGRAGQAEIWDSEEFNRFEQENLTPEKLLASLEAIGL